MRLILISSIKLVLKFSLLLLIGSVFSILNIPVPWLLGGLTGSLLLNLFKIPIAIPSIFRAIILSLFGLQMGGMLTEETIFQLRLAPHLLLGLFVIIPIYILFSTWLHQRVMKLDKQNSFLCSIPGQLSYVIVLAQELNANLPLITLIHTVRLILLIAIIPILVIGTGVSNQPISVSFSLGAPLSIILTFLLVAFCVFIGNGLQKFKINAPWLILAIMIAAIAQFHFHYSLQPAHFIITINQLLLACLLSNNFNSAHLKRPLKFYVDIIIILLINLVFIALFSLLINMIFFVDFEVTYLSYMPGGLEAMILIAITVASNPLLVSAAHIVRVIYLAFLLPILGRIMGILK